MAKIELLEKLFGGMDIPVCYADTYICYADTYICYADTYKVTTAEVIPNPIDEWAVVLRLTREVLGEEFEWNFVEYAWRGASVRDNQILITELTSKEIVTLEFYTEVPLILSKI